MIRGFYFGHIVGGPFIKLIEKKLKRLCLVNDFYTVGRKSFVKNVRFVPKTATWYLEFCAGLTWRKFLLVKSEIKF